MASPVQLPDSIVFYNILPRLPFRALMRLTAVCKAWRRTICLDDAFAAAQSQIPSRASVAIARFVEDSLELEILSPCSDDVVPPDPCLSFVEVDHSRLSFCACTGGVVLLKERPDDPEDGAHRQRVCNFLVVNPNRKADGIRRVPYDCEGEVVTAGLAYDPETAPSEGFRLVVPVVEDGGRCRFRRFTSRRGEWSASREAFAMPPLEEFRPKPVYGNGHMYWLAGDVLVWYDLDSDCAGTVPLRTAGSRLGCDTKLGIGAWRGRLRVAYVNTRGVSVSELAGGGDEGPQRWEVVHSRLWREVPCLVCPQNIWERVRWELGTVEMEAGGEEAVCVVLTMERERERDPDREREREREHDATWRGLLRYDVRTGAALSVLELSDQQKIGPLMDYHSSMAKLPDIMWDRCKHPQIHK